MNIKKLLIASTLISSGSLASCELINKEKKLSVDDIRDGICNLTVNEGIELQREIAKIAKKIKYDKD
ncbi:SEC-dependent effector SDE5640 [Candidatus Liberibacter brunswickensis]|uniref:SEC-dependent effector SDE5640 n=1 Tax=Candidatus Liberibacter brunswickensis TaxID=1968796 RepID=UPI002FE0AE3C